MNQDGPKTVRVTITKRVCNDGEYETEGRWYLTMIDGDAPVGEAIRLDDTRLLGMVAVNKEISHYLREILSMIDDELPEKG